MASLSANKEPSIQEFCDVTSASKEDAQLFLEANAWDISAAVIEYYTSQEEGIATAQEGNADPQETEAYTGPRTLDGRPAPSAMPPNASISTTLVNAPRRSGVATLSSLKQGVSGGHEGHRHGHEDDDDGDEDDDDFDSDEQPRDLFAGGEKSALAVQDPSRGSDGRKIVNDILKKTLAQAGRYGGEPSGAETSRFRGAGQTLGGDDTPSLVIPDPSARPAEAAPIQTRNLHLWNDGFSVEDGPLKRFDDPQNATDLEMIRKGRAPLHLLGVQPNQPIDVQLVKHEIDYTQAAQKYKPFSGTGNRLGSPVPGAATVTTSNSVPVAAAKPTSSTSAAPEVNVDSSQPTIALRIQLANGTRLPARFNTTHTIGDVYEFISRASSDSGTREWVLASTFPSKNHTDKSLVLGDMAEFKRGGTAVQKWV